MGTAEGRERVEVLEAARVQGAHEVVGGPGALEVVDRVEHVRPRPAQVLQRDSGGRAGLQLRELQQRDLEHPLGLLGVPALGVGGLDALADRDAERAEALDTLGQCADAGLEAPALALDVWSDPRRQAGRHLPEAARDRIQLLPEAAHLLALADHRAGVEEHLGHRLAARSPAGAWNSTVAAGSPIGRVREAA